MLALRSLRSLTLAFLLSFFLAVALTGFATYRATQRAIVELVDERIDALSDAILSQTRPGDIKAIIERINVITDERDTGNVGFMLTDAKGQWLGGNVRLARPLALGYSTLGRRDRITGLSAGRALVRDAGSGLMLTTIAETEPIDRENSERRRLYMLGFGSIVLIVLAGTALFGALVSRRIGEVRETARAIIDGDMQRRIAVDPSGGAFAEQAATFNHMLDRIAELMRQISNVSNDIAHDMRTPLARLRGRLALIAARPEWPRGDQPRRRDRRGDGAMRRAAGDVLRHPAHRRGGGRGSPRRLCRARSRRAGQRDRRDDGAGRRRIRP